MWDIFDEDGYWFTTGSLTEAEDYYYYGCEVFDCRDCYWW